MTDVTILRADDVVALHDRLLAEPGWPGRGDDELDGAAGCKAVADAPLWRAVRANHWHNACLWTEEDLARRTAVGAAEIAANKRAIDRHNQARNDAIERVDEWLLLALGLVDSASVGGDSPRSKAPAGARLHSETAGSMIDRLSILALKARAMRAQAARADVDDAHRALCAARLARLVEQRADLAGCLDALVADARAGRAYFKVYRQFKMYNDPRFNPALVAEARRGAG